MEENNIPQQPQENTAGSTNPQPIQPQNTDNKNSSSQILSIVGFVLAIIALIISFIPCVGLYAIFPGAIGLILTIIGMVQINKSGGSKGLSIAGMIISIVAIIIAGIQYFYISSATDQLKDAAIDMEQFSKDMQDMTDDLDNMTEDKDDDLDKEQSENIDSDIQKLINEKNYDKLIEMYDNAVGEYVENFNKFQHGNISASMKMVTSGAKISVIAMKIATILPLLSEEQQNKFDAINDKYDNILKEREKSE